MQAEIPIDQFYEIPIFKGLAKKDAQDTPFCDFAVLDDSKKYTPFPQNLEQTWLPLFMLSWGTGLCNIVFSLFFSSIHFLSLWVTFIYEKPRRFHEHVFLPNTGGTSWKKFDGKLVFAKNGHRLPLPLSLPLSLTLPLFLRNLGKTLSAHVVRMLYPTLKHKVFSCWD